MSSLLGSCPYRDLDWIFQRAQLLNLGDQVMRPSRNMDGNFGFNWIHKTSRYLQNIQAQAQDLDLYTVIRQSGGLHWAFGLYTNPTLPGLRLSLELAIIGKLTDQEIADRLGFVTPQVAKTYEAVFYNLRPYMHSEFCVPLILSRNLDPAERRMPLPNLYRLCAWFRGLDYTMALINRFASVDHVDRGMAIATMTEDVSNALKSQALIAANQVTTIGPGANELVANFIKNREVETKDNLNDTSTDQLAMALEVLQEQVSGIINIGGYDPATGQLIDMPAPLLLNSAVEPQLSAIMQPAVMRRLETASYPNMIV